MKFKIIYIEITNICGLACSFCPPKPLPSKTMSLEFFQKILDEIKPYTNLIALHVMGDPFVLSNLREYLLVAHKNGFLVELTTSGFYMNNHSPSQILKAPLRQLNISLNAYNKNSTNISLDDYLNSIFLYIEHKLKHNPSSFINLRVWNLDELESEARFNDEIFRRLREHFGVNLSDVSAKSSIRLAPKVLLHFDNYFEWPSLLSTQLSHAPCHGLSSQLAILCSGVVVPCCLDSDGVIALGDLNTQSLDDILSSDRAKAIKDGFKNGVAIEELCQKCSFKDRFAK